MLNPDRLTEQLTQMAAEESLNQAAAFTAENLPEEARAKAAKDALVRALALHLEQDPAETIGLVMDRVQTLTEGTA